MKPAVWIGIIVGLVVIGGGIAAYFAIRGNQAGTTVSVPTEKTPQPFGLVTCLSEDKNGVHTVLVGACKAEPKSVSYCEEPNIPAKDYPRGKCHERAKGWR